MKRQLVFTLVFIAVWGCSGAEIDPGGVEGGPDGKTDDRAWYNKTGFRSVFGDFDRLEPVAVVDPAQKAALVERGRYLATGLAACGSCHGVDSTQPETPLAGGRKMADRFGDLVAPNITPDRETGIGAWNVPEVVRAIRSSIDREGRPLSIDLHSGYRWLSDEDSRAIAVYLLAQQPLANQVERRRLGGVERNRLGLFSQHSEVPGYVPAPRVKGKGGVREATKVEYGRYLASHVARCESCHTGGGGVISGVVPFAGSSGVKRTFFGSVRALVSLFKLERSKADAPIAGLLSKEGREQLSEEVSEKDEIEKEGEQESEISPTNGALNSGDVADLNFPVGGPDIRGTSGGVISSWSEEDIVSYLSTGRTPGGEQRDGRLCPWPSFRSATDSDKSSIASFLKSL